MNFPTDSIQNIVDSWWEKRDEENLKKGSLIYAFVPHVEQVPLTLVPIGRKDAGEHKEAKIEIGPLRINEPHPREALPVAALSLYKGELWTAYRAKKRPCLVIGTAQPRVDDSLRRGMPKRSTSPTLLVAPYYGVNKNGLRAGYNSELVKRIRHAGYPQFMLDQLPISGPKESILRFDHIQPIGLHNYAYEYTGFCLSEEAVDLILDDWLKWIFFDGLPVDSLIIAYQEQIISIYG